MRESIEKLLFLGLDINAQNSEGETPLLVLLSPPIVVSEHYFTTVECVIEHGADPRIAKKGGITALDLARKSFPWSYPAYRLIQNSIKALNLK
jgi:ankyrin repeat protein